MAKSNPKNADEGKVKKLETELEAMTVESKNYANEGKEMADADPEAFTAYKDKIAQLSAAMTEK